MICNFGSKLGKISLLCRNPNLQYLHISFWYYLCTVVFSKPAEFKSTKACNHSKCKEYVSLDQENNFLRLDPVFLLSGQ